MTSTESNGRMLLVGLVSWGDDSGHRIPQLDQANDRGIMSQR